MKTLFTFLIGALTLGAAVPALAGPDWQIIEHGRQVKAARMQAAAAAAQAAARPRPTESPDKSQEMAAKEAHEKMMRECAAMMKAEQPGAEVK